MPFLLNQFDDAFAGDLVSIGPYGEDDGKLVDDMELPHDGPTPVNSVAFARLNAIDPNTIRFIDGLAPEEYHDAMGL
jgi:hypothetical protein